MNRILLTCLAVFLLASAVAAETDRSVEAARSVQAYRPVGDRRVWSFFSRDSTFGRLVSTVSRTASQDGRPGLVLTEELTIDYTMIGGEQVIRQSREHYVDLTGGYLGDRMTLITGEQSEDFRLSRQGGRVNGYFTRAGREVPQSLEVDTGMSGWDNNYVDQLELILAMRDLRVGQRISDSVFQPQALVKTRLTGTVDRFFYQEIYRNRFDSVFLIRLSEPVRAELSFTADRRLVKVNLLDQDIRIYQDEAPRTSVPEREAVPSPRFTVLGLVVMLPHYVTYLLISLVSLLFFARRDLRRGEPYLGYSVGALLFLAALVTQIPLQKMMIAGWFVPSVSSGGSLYLRGIPPSLAAGLIQELLKLAAVWLVISWRKPTSGRCAVIGAFCGAGFGVANVWYHVGWHLAPLFTFALLERSFLVLYHVASGALLGNAVGGDRGRLPATLTILVLVNSVLRYLPVFVQEGTVSGAGMTFVFAFLSVGFLLFAVIRLGRQ
ncbi:MAG TPA: hypothetical protein VMY05_05000 [Acidobacteriota bacterium]|nr:hypothetical protein [Acidobacteriota bacterium]